MSVPLRTFAKTSDKISAVGYGAMSLAAFYGNVSSQEECNKVFDKLVELGVNFWDTSDIYSTRKSLGENEEQIGSWFKSSGNRDKVFLCTKWGFTLSPTGERGQKGDEVYVQGACADSLKRLQTDRIDLYYHHRPSTKPEEIASAARGMKKLKDEGKIRYVGVSEYNLAQLKEFNEICHIDAYQIEISLATPEPLFNGLVDWCINNGTEIVPYSPMSRGLLSGAYKKREELFNGQDDFRAHNARFTEEAWEHNQKLVHSCQEIASKHSASVGQIAIAWLLAQSDMIVPIPGSTKVANIEENVKAANVKLDKTDLEELNKLVKEFKVLGERYPEAYKATLAF